VKLEDDVSDFLVYRQIKEKIIKLPGLDKNYGNVPHYPFSEFTAVEIQLLKNKFMENLKLTESEIQELEKPTKIQHRCDK
jgi:hypothetical protein